MRDRGSRVFKALTGYVFYPGLISPCDGTGLFFVLTCKLSVPGRATRLCGPAGRHAELVCGRRRLLLRVQRLLLRCEAEYCKLSLQSLHRRSRSCHCPLIRSRTPARRTSPSPRLHRANPPVSSRFVPKMLHLMYLLLEPVHQMKHRAKDGTIQNETNPGGWSQRRRLTKPRSRRSPRHRPPSNRHPRPRPSHHPSPHPLYHSAARSRRVTRVTLALHVGHTALTFSHRLMQSA